MKRFVIIVAIIAVLCIGVVIVFRLLPRGKAYSGPGVSGNLSRLQSEKEVWQASGHTNEWPTAEDLFPYQTHGRSLNEILRSRYGELYFINRTGAPVFAYVPKTNGSYRVGELWILTSNGLTVVRQ